MRVLGQHVTAVHADDLDDVEAVGVWSKGPEVLSPAWVISPMASNTMIWVARLSHSAFARVTMVVSGSPRMTPVGSGEPKPSSTFSPLSSTSSSVATTVKDFSSSPTLKVTVAGTPDQSSEVAPAFPSSVIE